MDAVGREAHTGMYREGSRRGAVGVTPPLPSPPLQVMQKQLGPLTDMCLKGLVDSHPKVSQSARG